MEADFCARNECLRQASSVFAISETQKEQPIERGHHHSSTSLAGLFDEDDLLLQEHICHQQSEFAHFFSKESMGERPFPYIQQAQVPPCSYYCASFPNHQHKICNRTSGSDSRLRETIPFIAECPPSSFQADSCSSTSSDMTCEGPVRSLVAFSRPPQAKYNLIRHSSLPTSLLSHLVMEDRSSQKSLLTNFSNVQTIVENAPLDKHEHLGPKEQDKCQLKQCWSGQYGRKQQMPVDDGMGKVIGGAGLVRQSSSPADMLSHIALDSMDLLPEDIKFGGSTGGQQAACDEATARKRLKSPCDPCMFRGVQHSSSGVDQTSLDSMKGYLPDSVLWKTRAKRGCATHPRSIAERVRRTRITDGIKRLQELIPNTNKQMNTSEMLDVAVEYVKLLQSQVQKLSETNGGCTGCSGCAPAQQ